MKGLILTSLLILTGCASFTEQEIADYRQGCEKNPKVLDVDLCVKERKKEEMTYRRVNRDSLFYEKYLRRKASCESIGGYMIVERWGPSSISCREENCPPRWGDTYKCSS